MNFAIYTTDSGTPECVVDATSQDVRGQDYRLLCFADPAQPDIAALMPREWEGNPAAAVGLIPIFVSGSYLLPGSNPITRVEAHT